MKKKHMLSGLALCLLFTATVPLSAGAVEEVDFKFRTTRALYNLCTVQPEDPLFSSARWACRGFLEETIH